MYSHSTILVKGNENDNYCGYKQKDMDDPSVRLGPRRVHEA